MSACEQQHSTSDCSSNNNNNNNNNSNFIPCPFLCSQQANTAMDCHHRVVASGQQFIPALACARFATPFAPRLPRRAIRPMQAGSQRGRKQFACSSSSLAPPLPKRLTRTASADLCNLASFSPNEKTFSSDASDMVMFHSDVESGLSDHEVDSFVFMPCAFAVEDEEASNSSCNSNNTHNMACAEAEASGTNSAAGEHDTVPEHLKALTPSSSTSTTTPLANSNAASSFRPIPIM
jgi:hypothetical protein